MYRIKIKNYNQFLFFGYWLFHAVGVNIILKGVKLDFQNLEANEALPVWGLVETKRDP